MTDYNLVRMYIIFIALVIFFILSFKSLKQQFKGVNKSAWVLLLIIFVLALVLRLSVPHYYKLYMDEPRYVEVAKNIVLHDQAQIMKYYGESTFKFFEPFHPIAWPFLMSVAFRVFGINGFVAGYLNTIISSLAVLMVFLFSYLLFKREDVGLWGGLLLALNPLHVHWSTSAGVNAPSLFFMLLSLTAFIIYCRNRDIKLHLLATFSFLFSVLMRLEYVMVFVLVASIYMLHWKTIKKEVRKLRFWLPWLGILLFYRNYYTTLMLFINKLRINGVALVFASSSGSFGLSKIVSNIGLLFQHILKTYSLMLLVFMLIGIYAIFRKRKSVLLMLLIWFVVFSGFYMSYVQFQERHLLFPMLAFQLVIAFGISYVLKLKQVKRYRQLLVAVLVILIVIFMVPRLLLIYNITDSNLLQTQVPEITEAAAQDCYIVASRPALVSSSADLKVIPLDYFLANDLVFSGLAGECVLLYNGSYLSSEDFHAVNEKYVLETFIDFRRGNTVFSLYNISAKG